MSRLRISALAASIATCGLIAPSLAHAAPGDFSSAGEFQVGTTPYDLTTGDFDDDDVLDAAVPNANGSSVSVLLGNGDGTFANAPESPITTSATPKGVAVGDLDGDGADDLIVTEDGTDAIRVLLSDGDGTFTQEGSPIAVGADPNKVEVGLFDGDAVLDVAVVNQSYATATGSVTVLLGNGTGGFAAAPGSPIAVGVNPTDVVAAHLSSDSNVDLAVTNSNGDNLSILLGSATGAFSVLGTEAAGDYPETLAVADLNGDFRNDLAVGNGFSENVTILLGSASGDFTQAATSPEPEGDSYVTLSDFDGDGDVDLAASEGNMSVVVSQNNGQAAFTPLESGPIAVLGLATHLAAGDTDGDGDNDILSTGGNGGYYAVTSLLNDETDTDGDGFADIGDECPDVAGSTRGCPFFPRQVTLKYKKRAAAFKGVVTSSEPACVGPGVKVNLRRSAASGAAFILVGKTKTDRRGKYRLDEKVGRGKFTARIASTTDPDVGICDAAVSPVIRVEPSNR